MLGNDFFQVSNLDVQQGTVHATITINPEHKIFEGHFPGQPVVPGVCMMQMLKEIVEQVVSKKTNLSKAHDMKFLAVIDPVKQQQVEVSINYSMNEQGSLAVTASFYKEALIHFKFKGQFDFQ